MQSAGKKAPPCWLYVVLARADTDIFFFMKEHMPPVTVILDDLALKEK